MPRKRSTPAEIVSLEPQGELEGRAIRVVRGHSTYAEQIREKLAARERGAASISIAERTLQKLEGIVQRHHEKIHGIVDQRIRQKRSTLLLTALLLEGKQPLSVSRLSTMTGYAQNTIRETAIFIRELLKESPFFQLTGDKVSGFRIEEV